MLPIIDRQNPEWAFAFEDISVTDLWYIHLYEYFREVDVLVKNMSRYWSRGDVIVPKTLEDLKSVATRNRALIGDLDNAAFLFSLPSFPAKPWLSLEDSERAVMMAVYPEQHVLFDFNNDPAYLLPASLNDATVECELLIDWRRPDTEIVKAIGKQWTQIRSSLDAPNQSLLTASRFKGLQLEPYSTYEYGIDRGVETKKLKEELKRWIPGNRVTSAQRTRDSILAKLKYLGIYRINRHLRERGYEINDRIIHSLSDYLYADTKSYYNAINKAERFIDHLTDSFSQVGDPAALQEALASVVIGFSRN